MKKKILFVVGARPQFIKHAPLELSFNKYFDCISIHTGQHYDKNMSDIFFKQLKIKEPSYKLSLGSLNHGEQTGRMMVEIERIVIDEKPDLILVYGDTNSTLAGALVGSKLNIPIVHVEAGLRSFNKEMPEEINRILTDHVSSILICPTDLAVENLKKEGIIENVFKTGDVMIDMLKIAQNSISPSSGTNQEYYYATIHRPYNTDLKDRLFYLLTNLNQLDKLVKFTIHPRTSKKMIDFGFRIEDYSNIEFIAPVSYFDNIKNIINSLALITDSGGMQKEAYVLKKKTITIRTETEWLETLDGAWNSLLFEKLEGLQDLLNVETEEEMYKESLYGDGLASEQICELVKSYLN